MEKRQSQVRVGAGLEESRLNQEFLDFLQKWSTPALVVLAVLAGGYWFYNKRVQETENRDDAGFRELDQLLASGDPSPDSLEQIAREYPKTGTVAPRARLEAADAKMLSVVTGIRPGAKLKPDGSLEDAADQLTDKDRDAMLAQAQGLYTQVKSDVEGNAAARPLAIGAMFGLAAVAESKGDLAQARQRYEEIVKFTDQTPFESKGVLAKRRIEGLGKLEKLPPLVSEAQIPKLPPLPEPAPPPGAPAPAAGPVAPDPTKPVLTPVDKPPFPVGPDGRPLPTSKPAEAPKPADAPPAGPK